MGFKFHFNCKSFYILVENFSGKQSLQRDIEQKAIYLRSELGKI